MDSAIKYKLSPTSTTTLSQDVVEFGRFIETHDMKDQVERDRELEQESDEHELQHQHEHEHQQEIHEEGRQLSCAVEPPRMGVLESDARLEGLCEEEKAAVFDVGLVVSEDLHGVSEPEEGEEPEEEEQQDVSLLTSSSLCDDPFFRDSLCEKSPKDLGFEAQCHHPTGMDAPSAAIRGDDALKDDTLVMDHDVLNNSEDLVALGDPVGGGDKLQRSLIVPIPNPMSAVVLEPSKDNADVVLESNEEDSDVNLVNDKKVLPMDATAAAFVVSDQVVAPLLDSSRVSSLISSPF